MADPCICFQQKSRAFYIEALRMRATKALHEENHLKATQQLQAAAAGRLKAAGQCCTAAGRRS